MWRRLPSVRPQLAPCAVRYLRGNNSKAHQRPCNESCGSVVLSGATKSGMKLYGKGLVCPSMIAARVASINRPAASASSSIHSKAILDRPAVGCG